MIEKIQNGISNNESTITSCTLLNDLNIEFSETEWKESFEGENLAKNSWTHQIFAKFYEKYHIPCPYSFKNGYVSKKMHL